MLSIRVCTKQKLHLTTKHPFHIALCNNTSRRKSNKNTGCRISPTKIPVLIYCCVATGTSLFSSPYQMETRSAKIGDQKNKRKEVGFIHSNIYLENVSERSCGELGTNTLIPGTCLLERYPRLQINILGNRKVPRRRQEEGRQERGRC